ncbi:MAG: hypothetical protein H7Y42_13440 [Chitinophagaceae bacterium]|nr:hypothetical protein [Chitinophagaceae bacterium]
MKETTFHIVLNLRTADGFEPFGKFFLGKRKDLATAVFDKLKGSAAIDNAAPLSFEFIEMRKNLPFNIEMISCTLDELSENCKIIAKETFKLFNLEHS